MQTAAATVKSRGKMSPTDQIAEATQKQDYNRAPDASSSKSKSGPLLLTGASTCFSSSSKKFDPYRVYVPMFRIAGNVNNVKAYMVTTLRMSVEQAELSINSQSYNYQNYQNPSAQIQIRDPSNHNNSIIVGAKAEFEAEINRRKALHPAGSKHGPQKDLHDLIRLVHLWEGKTVSASGASVRSSRSASLAERLQQVMPSIGDSKGHWLNVTEFKGDITVGGSMKGATKAPIPKGRSPTFAQIDHNDPELSRVVFDPTKLSSGGAIRFLIRYMKERRNIDFDQNQAINHLRTRHVGAEAPAQIHATPAFGQSHGFASQNMMAPPTQPAQQQVQPQFSQQQVQPQFSQQQQVQPQFSQQQVQPQFSQQQQVQPQFSQQQQVQPFMMPATSSPKTQLPKPVTPTMLPPTMLPPQFDTPTGLISKPASPKLPGAIPTMLPTLPAYGSATQ